jgi:hypothetical protein
MQQQIKQQLQQLLQHPSISKLFCNSSSSFSQQHELHLLFDDSFISVS